MSVIHKGNYKRKVWSYSVLGQDFSIPAPLCKGKTEAIMWENFIVSRNWNKVTCKRCLKLNKTLDISNK